MFEYKYYDAAGAVMYLPGKDRPALTGQWAPHRLAMAWPGSSRPSSGIDTPSDAEVHACVYVARKVSAALSPEPFLEQARVYVTEPDGDDVYLVTALRDPPLMIVASCRGEGAVRQLGDWLARRPFRRSLV